SFSHIGRMGLLGGLGLAGVFYAAAEYEHMTGWKWALASIAVSATIKTLFPLSFIFVLPAQFGLFCVMWWMNSKRQAALEVERAASQDADRRGWRTWLGCTCRCGLAWSPWDVSSRRAAASLVCRRPSWPR